MRRPLPKISLTSMTLLPDSYSNCLSPRAVQPYKEKGTAFMITFIPLHDLVPHVGCQDLRLWGSTPVRIIVRSIVLCVPWRQRAAPAPPWGDVGSPSIYTSLPLPPKRHKFGSDHLHLYLPRWEISTMPTILSLTTLLLSTKKGTSTLPMSVATPGLEQVGIQLETTPVSANNCNIGRHYWRKMSPQATLGVRPSWGNPSHRITNIREKDEAYPSQQKPGRECSQILGLWCFCITELISTVRLILNPNHSYVNQSYFWLSRISYGPNHKTTAIVTWVWWRCGTNSANMPWVFPFHPVCFILRNLGHLLFHFDLRAI